jgi:hypothetical protein
MAVMITHMTVMAVIMFKQMLTLPKYRLQLCRGIRLTATAYSTHK